jgi:hypothetical protein
MSEREVRRNAAPGSKENHQDGSLALSLSLSLSLALLRPNATRRPILNEVQVYGYTICKWTRDKREIVVQSRNGIANTRANLRRGNFYVCTHLSSITFFAYEYFMANTTAAVCSTSVDFIHCKWPCYLSLSLSASITGPELCAS